MNLDQIETKSFIMALFIRDDNERFLLGTGAYEFKDSQLHFAGNTIENDVVSIQGNDGYMLAGQVRRPTTQVFDGYIGDATVSKAEVEGFRRDFFAFFRKNHFYTVVYIMADGSAIQRRRGFLVDAPTVKELWQMYPEYHIGLNFEDINYYKYSENTEGEETYAKSADVGLAKAMYGGLIWEEDGTTTVTGTGTNITLAGTMEGGAIDSVEMNGDTQQQTYSGKNLYEGSPDFSGTWNNEASWTTSSQTYNGMVVKQRADAWAGLSKDIPVVAGKTYTFSLWAKADTARTSALYIGGGGATATVSTTGKDINLTTSWQRYFLSFSVSASGNARPRLENKTTLGTNAYICGYQIEESNSMTDYEPYVGGTASPNPDYPQAVQTVTGRQVVTITDGDSQSQEYEVNLGKNLLDESTMESGSFNYLNGGLFANNTFIRSQKIPCQPNTTYAFSSNSNLGEFAVVYYGSDGTTVVPGEGYLANYKTTLFTSPAGAYYMRVKVGGSANPRTTDGDWDLQLELGSVTTYAPYFTPIELCKIGTYQDYIYKSGDDWYIHKDLAKVVLDGSDTSNYGTLGNGTGGIKRFRYSRSDIGNVPDDIRTTYCDIYQGIQRRYTLDIQNSISQYIQQNMLNITTSSTTYTLNDYLSFLSSNPATVYYVLATPTDTKITNATLISELDSLLSATTYDNNTYITVSGDLASPLEVVAEAFDGGGVEWDANGAVWEDGGGGATTVVAVDSIDNVLPVWTITGKSVNPVLTNLTTAMSISYNGTIAQGQTLVVDLLNKTAKLNGTSVIQNISGSWVEFAPGNNKVSYTTDNSDAPDSTIEWQEIVG